uniref:Uncharacterized protein n=1 Tax=Salix viminalis TaxID=40686 RepID=A0A6N2JWS5_SALVM
MVIRIVSCHNQHLERGVACNNVRPNDGSGPELYRQLYALPNGTSKLRAVSARPGPYSSVSVLTPRSPPSTVAVGGLHPQCSSV